MLADPAATYAAGRRAASAVLACRPGILRVYLEGDLGAGKTTFARGFLEALGHPGRVPSPTYTLIEPYELAGYLVYHIDLYRIRDASELDDLDLGGQLVRGSIALVEWPSHGGAQLPPADLKLHLDLLPEGRVLTGCACTTAGREVLARIMGGRSTRIDFPGT